MISHGEQPGRWFEVYGARGEFSWLGDRGVAQGGGGSPSHFLLRQALVAAMLLFPVAVLMWQLVDRLAQSASRADLVGVLISKVRPVSPGFSASASRPLPAGATAIAGLKTAVARLEIDAADTSAATAENNFVKYISHDSIKGEWPKFAHAISDDGFFHSNWSWFDTAYLDPCEWDLLGGIV